MIGNSIQTSQYIDVSGCRSRICVWIRKVEGKIRITEAKQEKEISTKQITLATTCVRESRSRVGIYVVLLRKGHKEGRKREEEKKKPRKGME